MPLRVAQGYTNLDINRELINRINTQIEENQIDVVTLDPLITLHGVPESDNTKMDSVIRIFAGIADAHDCAIEISHHMRKPAAGSNGDYGAADIRGASAIHDAVRSARILNRMAEKEANDLGLQEHERAAEFVFLQLLDRYTLEGRGVSERPSRNYAPALFAEEAEAKMARQNKVTLRSAMLRLFKLGRIRAVDEGSGGSLHRLVRVNERSVR